MSGGSIGAHYAVGETMDNVEELRRRIRETEQELVRLREELTQAETGEQTKGISGGSASQSVDATPWKWPLSPEDYERYARQLIISQVGVPGK